MNKERRIRFIRWQIESLKEGGFRILLRKLWILLKILCEFLIALMFLPAIVIVRLLRPIVLIRFGLLKCQRIGHFAMNTELYLCERDIGLQPQNAIDIFYNYDRRNISNYQLQKMWGRILRTHAAARYLFLANRMLPGRKRHEVQWPSDLDTNSSLYRARTHLFFTPDEERAGRRALEDLGIRDGEPFVCFHVRDDSYLNALIRNEWSYHNYRDSSIDNIIPAVIELARRGYFAVRMGSVCKEGLAAGGDRIIDYAKRGRTDFLDVYLPSRCRFFLGTTAGIISVAAIFRRPIAFCNSIPLEYMINCGVEGVFIPKKLWLRKEKRFMTLDEILRSGAGRFIHSEGYEKMGIEVIENSPEEITALVAEMDERLNDRWRSCEEDGGLYAKFLAVCRPYLRRREIVPRIGTDFLRKNREFVER